MMFLKEFSLCFLGSLLMAEVRGADHDTHSASVAHDSHDSWISASQRSGTLPVVDSGYGQDSDSTTNSYQDGQHQMGNSGNQQYMMNPSNPGSFQRAMQDGSYSSQGRSSMGNYQGGMQSGMQGGMQGGMHGMTQGGQAYNMDYMSAGMGMRSQPMMPMPRVTKALAVMSTPSNSAVRGMVVFSQNSQGGVTVTGNITGLQPRSTHGFHVHEFGDLSNGCMSAGSHFNPENATHGGHDADVRHIGDLGNIVADQNGMVMINISDNRMQLTPGRNDIVGRTVVVHERVDDYGQGGSSESLTTGNAGGRLACGIIGVATMA